jgi:hypothetical protein
MSDRRQQPSPLIVVHQTPTSLDLSRASERPVIATLSSNPSIVASRNSNKPVSEARSLVIWDVVSVVLVPPFPSQRSPGFNVLAQPLSARQKLVSFLLHRVFGTTHLRFATKLFLELRTNAVG